MGIEWLCQLTEWRAALEQLYTGRDAPGGSRCNGHVCGQSRRLLCASRALAPSAQGPIARGDHGAAGRREGDTQRLPCVWGAPWEEERVACASQTKLPECPRPQVIQYRGWGCRGTVCGPQVRGWHPNLGSKTMIYSPKGRSQIPHVSQTRFDTSLGGRGGPQCSKGGEGWSTYRNGYRF